MRVLLLVLTMAAAGFAQRRPVLAVDAWHNNEAQPHYRWEGVYMGGYFDLHLMLERLGYETATLAAPFSAASLKGIDYLLVVDPDLPSEAKDPKYVTEDEAAAADAWVRLGGTLLLFTNDKGNAEFEHFNRFAKRFGVEFDPGPHQDEKGQIKLTLKTPAGGKLLEGGLHFYAVQVAPLILTAKDRDVLLESNGKPMMALIRHGRGRVVALGDPWLYNEYIRSQDNYRLGEGLFRALLAR
jgi:unsaturated rhamnogalacturonyl hydrolase